MNNKNKDESTKPEIADVEKRASKEHVNINNNRRLATDSGSAEMAQMVCGTCQSLLSYPRGARYVNCSCCHTLNYVLEESEIGQVECSYCGVLLMYPYRAITVRCSSCHSVTRIGAQNIRPPWSVQQGRPGSNPPPSSVA